MSYAAELREKYAAVRYRLTHSQKPLECQERPRRFLVPPVPKPEPYRIPEAVRRKVQVPKVIHARVDGDDFLPLPDAERWKVIVAEVCEKYGIDWIELASDRRPASTVIARHEAMYRMRNETTMSLPAIGQKLGGRDHSSVFHGIRRHEERMAAQALEAREQ